MVMGGHKLRGGGVRFSTEIEGGGEVLAIP